MGFFDAVENETPASALVAALEHLNTLGENAGEDQRARALLRVDAARNALRDEDRATFAPVLEAMGEMPDLAQMVKRTGRYDVEALWVGFGGDYVVRRHDDVAPPNARLTAVTAALAWCTVTAVIAVMMPGALIVKIAASVIAALVTAGATVAVTASKRREAAKGVKTRVACISAEQVEEKYDVKLSDIGADHPELAQWLLDYHSLPASTPPHIEASMKRRLQDMANCEMSDTRIMQRLYELRHGVPADEPSSRRVRR